VIGEIVRTHINAKTPPTSPYLKGRQGGVGGDYETQISEQQFLKNQIFSVGIYINGDQWIRRFGNLGIMTKENA